MTSVTDEDLGRLLELSDVDARIARLTAQLADLPEQQAVEAAGERLHTKVTAGDELRVELTTVEGEQRRLERDLEQFRTRLDHERTRLYGGEVTNAREMKSVEAEIEATQRRIDEHETELLEAMETAEDLETRGEDLARAAEQTRAEIVELESARDEAAGVLLGQRAELEVERDGLREALGADALRAYDGVRQRVPAGAAVGELDGRACTSCRIELPHAEVNELRDGPPLATCPSCRRLLVVR